MEQVTNLVNNMNSTTKNKNNQCLIPVSLISKRSNYFNRIGPKSLVKIMFKQFKLIYNMYSKC